MEDGTAGLSDDSVVGDWRLPTKNELYALTHGTEAIRCASGPCDLYGFTGVLSEYYWSSTTHEVMPYQARLVHAGTGYVDSATKHFDWNVWPVRGP